MINPPTASQVLSQVRESCVTPAAKPSCQKEGVWTCLRQSRSKKVDASLNFCPWGIWTSGTLVDNYPPLFAITVSAEVNAELLCPSTPAPAAGEPL